jgi:hypothetical protein
MQFDCCIGIFRGAAIHCLLVAMATVEVTPYFRWFFNYTEKQKGSPNINKYCQQCLHSFTNN